VDAVSSSLGFNCSKRLDRKIIMVRKTNKNEKQRLTKEQLGGRVLKVLVTYYSDTGNTEKIAKAIYEEASKNHQAQLKKIKEVKPEDLGNYDLVFLGAPCQANDLAAPAKRLLNTIPRSPKFKVAGFFTHMSPVSEKHSGHEKCVACFQNISKEKQIGLEGLYDCQGMPAPKLLEIMKKNVTVSDDQWEKSVQEMRKHPSTEDIKKAKEFAQHVLAKL
jgi:flavodoxin I